MTPKQNALRFIATLPDDVAYDRIMYHIDVMRAAEKGRAQIERGEGIDHDQLFDELLAEDAESQNNLVAGSKTRSTKDPAAHRKKRSANGSGVRRKVEKGRRATKRLP